MFILPSNTPIIHHDGRDFYQIEGASTAYVCTDGAVLSIARKKWAFLTHHDNAGYKQVSVMLDAGGRGLLYVHRVVAGRFIPNPEPATRTDIDHLDGNKANNAVDNLEWVTKSENTRRAYASGLMKAKQGEEHHLFGRPVSEATRAKQSEAKQGENHPRFTGWYITPAGPFPSAQLAADALGTYPKKVDRWCKDGKHKAEGFDFEPKTPPQALAKAA